MMIAALTTALLALSAPPPAARLAPAPTPPSCEPVICYGPDGGPRHVKKTCLD